MPCPTRAARDHDKFAPGDSMPAKRYFEFSEGSSNKFWEVWCDGAEVFTRYGKIGANGQLTVKDMGSKEAAKAQHDKLVKEKAGKGYVEKGAKKPAKPTQPANGETVPVEVPPGAWRLEATEGKSRKFWQIKLDGKSYEITFGKVGTAGQKQKKKHKDEWNARMEYNELLREKTRKGYTYVYGGKHPKVAAKPAQNAQLEAQIVKDPHNDDNLAVYADWLQEQGDVRGELAGLQLATKGKKLSKAAQKLVDEYRTYFWGPLAVYYDPKASEDDRAVFATWRAGWIDELELAAPSEYGEWKGPYVADVAELVRYVGKLDSARFVRSIVITKPVADGEFEFQGAVTELVKLIPSLPCLRRLEIGRFDYRDSELSWSHMGSLHKLWPLAKHLEYVKLRAGSMELGKIDLPECREFRLETGGLSRGSAKAVAAAHWPKLETLSVWFGSKNYGGDTSEKDVQPILDAKGLSKVRHLGLKNCERGNEMFALLAKSKILKQLDTLDLSMSHITTTALKQDVLPHKAAFAHLSHLDLSRCRLDKEGEKLARTLCKKVELASQDKPSDWEGGDYRYCAVGE
jgi:uncharacterized protein (TIGR02996 family)